MIAPQRTIKSWISRIGDITAKQKKILEQSHLKEYYPAAALNDFTQKIKDLSALYNSVMFDIGFGNGITLIALAERFPSKLIIGFEPHLTGVAHALEMIHEKDIRNVIIFQGDVLDFMETKQDFLVDRINIYFSDPWPKTRHHKRRLIQNKFLNLAGSKMCSNTILHIATDWLHYAEHIQECINNQHDYLKVDPKDIDEASAFVRPLTKYEARGLKLGHQIYEFYLKRN